MAKNNYDDSDGVWRTIGGRRVFIKNGQSLSDAMKASGKFKTSTKKGEAKYDSVEDRYNKDKDFKDMLKKENEKTLEATRKEIKSYLEDKNFFEKNGIESEDDLYKQINDNYYNISRDDFDKLFNEEKTKFENQGKGLTANGEKKEFTKFPTTDEAKANLENAGKEQSKQQAQWDKQVADVKKDLGLKLTDRDAKDVFKQLNDEGSDFTFNDDVKIEDGMIKTDVGVFMPDERGYVNRELEIPISENETYESLEEKMRDWEDRHSTPDSFEDKDFPNEAESYYSKQGKEDTKRDLEERFNRLKNDYYDEKDKEKYQKFYDDGMKFYNEKYGKEDRDERAKELEKLNKQADEYVKSGQKSANDFDKLDNYEVYEKADALARETKDYALRDEINKKLDRIDRANRRGSGYAEKPTNELREILKNQQASKSANDEAKKSLDKVKNNRVVEDTTTGTKYYEVGNGQWRSEKDGYDYYIDFNSSNKDNPAFKDVATGKIIDDNPRSENYWDYENRRDKYDETSKSTNETMNDKIRAGENKEDRKKRMAQSLAKMYDVDRETAEKYYNFPKDIQNVKKYGGVGKYDESEWTKPTNETMNDKIREKASKKTQGEQYEDYKRAKLGLQTNDNLDLTKENDRFLAKAQALYDRDNGKISDEEYNKKLVDIDSNSGKTTNDTMNKAIKEKATKKSTYTPDLPKKTEIKEQGTSNRKEVSENIQAHILDYYDSPQDFIKEMDAMDYLPITKWKQGEELAKGGSYLIYNGDMSDFLDELKINPKGKKFSEDKAFDMYTSLIGRESAKLYDRLQKDAYRKYKQEHPLSQISFEEFKDKKKK